MEEDQGKDKRKGNKKREKINRKNAFLLVFFFSFLHQMRKIGVKKTKERNKKREKIN